MKLPQKVRIIELTPRDGFQSIQPWIETAEKIAVINKLFDAGADFIEATSFVSPKAIPQLKDAAEIIKSLRDSGCDMAKIVALVPNLRGAENAVDAGVQQITLVISASEEHNLNNVRRTPAQSLEGLEEIRSKFPDLHIKLDIATVFGCPFIGEVALEKICFIIDRALQLDIRDIILCDTVGVANPLQTHRLLSDLLERYADRGIDWGMHMHNTRGLAAANTFAGLMLGIDRYETAAGGLGGCPFAPGASGNMATEDLLFMLNQMGIASAMDIDAVLACSEYMQDKLQLNLDAKVTRLTNNTTPGACS